MVLNSAAAITNQAGPPPVATSRPGGRRGRILQYLASHGGELRADSTSGLRRQIADALGERPEAVSQTLLALQRAGLIEREFDVDRNRCQAIRLVPPERFPARKRRPRHRRDVLDWGLDCGELLAELQRLAGAPEGMTAFAQQQVELATVYLEADRDRLSRDLTETEGDLRDATRLLVQLTHKVDDLEAELRAARTLLARSA